MPRIRDDILNCVVYIYPTKTHAERSMGWGGTGFLVSVPAPESVPRIGDLYAGHTYIVSNGHVVQPMGTECWIRFNTYDGKFDCIKTNPGLWSYSETSDLAVIKMPLLDIDKYDISAISTVMFLDKERVVSKGVGVGDETFVVGRFVNHDGKQRNKPTARFGTIAMMPDAGDGVFNEYLAGSIGSIGSDWIDFCSKLLHTADHTARSNHGTSAKNRHTRSTAARHRARQQSQRNIPR